MNYLLLYIISMHLLCTGNVVVSGSYYHSGDRISSELQASHKNLKTSWIELGERVYTYYDT
jgi:hypothetical protein